MSINFEIRSEDDLDFLRLQEEDKAFEAFLADNPDFLIPEDQQARYEEWCEGQELDAAEDNWEAYFDAQLPWED